MSGAARTAGKGGAAPRPARPAPRQAAPRRAGGKPTAMASRFGRLGRHGVAVVLGLGAVVLAPFVHAFWGDLGVILLGVFVLGFLLGRWTAPQG
jgi:hypothetical protein